MAIATHPDHGKIFGFAAGDFGLVASLLMSVSLGVAAFFATCFLAILGILFYNAAGHHVDFADSYKFFALPAGLVVLAISLVGLISLWLRRKFSGN
jgi:H+/Cl- antiporter ClcA